MERHRIGTEPGGGGGGAAEEVVPERWGQDGGRCRKETEKGQPEK